VIAHVGGVPLEEILPALPGAGAFLVLARGRLMLRLRRGRGDEPAIRRATAPTRADAERRVTTS
jgi:hypothetical protein